MLPYRVKLNISIPRIENVPGFTLGEVTPYVRHALQESIEKRYSKIIEPYYNRIYEMLTIGEDLKYKNNISMNMRYGKEINVVNLSESNFYKCYKKCVEVKTKSINIFDVHRSMYTDLLEKIRPLGYYVGYSYSGNECSIRINSINGKKRFPSSSLPEDYFNQK